MAKFKIERKKFEDKLKAWEMWQDYSYEERIFALEKMRKIAFGIQKAEKNVERKS